MNGGYLRARNTTAQVNCAVCECPEGWGGVDCSGMSAILSLNHTLYYYLHKCSEAVAAETVADNVCCGQAFLLPYC